MAFIKLTNSCGKRIEVISHAHITSSMLKIVTYARGADDLPIGCDRDRKRLSNELTNNKTNKRKKLLEVCSVMSSALQNGRKNLHMV